MSDACVIQNPKSKIQNRAVYLYAVMAGGRQLDLGRIGLPDGLTRVATLATDGLSAVVGECRALALGQLPKAELLRCLAIHQRVVERAMAAHPVLPARFGTVLASRDQVRAALARWHGHLVEALAQLGDAVEIEIAATWDLPTTFGEIGRQPEIAALAACAPGLSAEDTVALRIQVGKLVKAALDRRRETCCQEVLRALAPLASDAQPNPLPTDELVLNVAFLVERARLDGFYTQVHRLDETFERRLTFRCIGPLPPYSFATVELVRQRPEELDAARRVLELGERVSMAELSASYRRLAGACHPDHHPGDPTAAARFAALAAAHAQVLAYLRAVETSQPLDGEGEQDGRYDLAPAVVEATPILRIRRVEPVGTDGPLAPPGNREPGHERAAAAV